MSSQNYPAVLTIAGSDSSGGAGIQADLKTFTVLKVYGMSVVTAITAQNTMGVQAAMELPLGLVRQQIESIQADIRPNAVKTGMLASVGVIELVAGKVAEFGCDYVCDPVMVAKGGDSLIAAEAIAACRRCLLPMATVLTPNRFEVMKLLGQEAAIQTVQQAREAARDLQGQGARNVIIKAIPDGDAMVDLLYDGEEFELLRGVRQPAGRSHGSGCTFSAAITAMLARGKSVREAAELARKVIDAAIAEGYPACRGIRPVNVMAWKGNDEV